MKIWLLLFCFLNLAFCRAQSTFKSSLTEYKYGNHDLKSPYRWQKTSITIDDDTITVVSYYNNQTEVRRWVVNNEEVITKDNSVVHQYFTELINAPKNKLLPTKFSLWEDLSGNAEFIDLEIPPFSNSANASNITIRFHIHYTF